MGSWLAFAGGLLVGALAACFAGGWLVYRLVIARDLARDHPPTGRWPMCRPHGDPEVAAHQIVALALGGLPLDSAARVMALAQDRYVSKPAQARAQEEQQRQTLLHATPAPSLGVPPWCAHQ